MEVVKTILMTIYNIINITIIVYVAYYIITGIFAFINKYVNAKNKYSCICFYSTFIINLV